ncbi:MAG TPA: pitrilysin family protein [Rhizomicrobium sp.]|jgi:zinc protease|nr:pitrilysin family protein [Rhizomicrobium sp.]
MFAGNASAVDVQTPPVPRGEQLWFVEDHTLPMIAMTVAIPAGSAYDPAGKPGLAAFAAALMDEGAGRLNSQQFQTALSNRAIHLSIGAERDWTIISLVTLSDNAHDAFQLLGTALAHPRFDAEAINRVRAQILSSLAQEQEDPDSVAAKTYYAAYFHDHPYGHPISGTAQAVSAIGAGDLKNFAATHWVRDNMRISVSGDVDKKTLAGLLALAFGGLPQRAVPRIAPVGRVGTSNVVFVPMAVPQPVAIFGLPGPLRSDPDFIPAYVANHILGGGGFSSRLTGEVRVKRGLTYDVSTSLNTYNRAGIFVGQVATRADGVRQTLDVVRKTMSDFASGGPTDKELADAKTYLTGSFPLAFSSNVGIAGQLNAFQRAGLPVDYIAKRNGLIDAVTLDDEKRVSKRLFNPSKLTVVVAGTLPPKGK